MKFKTAVIVIFGFIFLSILGVTYYAHLQHRAILIKYVADFIDGTIIQAEDHIISELEKNGTSNNIQKILDKTGATHRFISSLSFSADGKKIDFSSDRTLRGQVIGSGYASVNRTAYNDLSKGTSLFHYTLNYFNDNKKMQAHLLLAIDKNYLFTTIERISEETTKQVFIFQLILLTVITLISIRLFISPLSYILQTAEAKNSNERKFFIEDFTLLLSTLTASFRTLQSQKEKLEISLNKTIYLDEILRTVADVNQLLITSESMDVLLQKSCERLAQFGHYKLAWIGFVENDRVNIRYKSSDPTEYLKEDLNISLDPLNPTSKGPSAKSILENKTIITNDLNTNPIFGPWQKRAADANFASSIALPLRKDLYSNAFGTITVYTDIKHGFDPQEINMLEELAGDIGFAIHSFRQDEAFKIHLITDSLTGLPNRTILFDNLKNYKEPKVAIINIDRLKDINEVYGFQVGDAVIKFYSEWLQQHIQKFGSGELYKLSGGEYAVLFADNSDEDKISVFITELIQATDESVFVYEDIEIFVTITVGYAKSHFKAIEYAEIALKRAKSKNWHFVTFDNSILMLEEQKNNILWYKTIKNAIKEDGIIPYFQPIVDNETGSIDKYEALMRLKMPDGKIMSPYHFLDISKKMRLYPELTKIMLSKTLVAFKGKELPVSINLSFDDIVEKGMQDFLYQNIKDADMGKQIIFEILESEGINSYEEVKAFMNKFRELGCAFAIDDFGSGYSNFDHILKLNIETLKIDGSLIKNLAHDRNAQIIVKNIHNFATEMNIKTVAEFVCDEAVFTHVKNIGIDLSQGYHFYEPSPVLVS